MLAFQEATRNGTVAPDITPALWAAIDRELRGDKQYSAHDAVDPAAAEREAQLDGIENYLHGLGVDLDDSDAKIRDAIEKDQDGKRYAQGSLDRDLLIWREKLRKLMQHKIADNADIRIGRVRDVLRALGVPAGQIVFRASKIRKIMEEHGNIGTSTLIDLPTLLADPVLVYEEVSKESDFVLVTDRKTANGYPVAIAVKAEGVSGQHAATVVLSVYPLERPEEKFSHVVRAGRVKYGRDYESVAGLEPTGANSLKGLFSQSPGRRSKNKILTAANVFKRYEQRPIFAPVSVTETTDNRNLFVAHNIKPDGLLNAAKIGGLPMPSLAVSRVDKGGFDSFGEITLLASPDLIDPRQDKSARVVNADAYSPRYPSVKYDIDDKKFRPIKAEIIESLKEIGGQDQHALSYGSIEENGIRAARDDVGMQYQFIKDRGLAFTPVLDTDGSPDWSANRMAIRDIIDTRRNDLADYVDKKLSGVIQRERIYKGFSPSGKRRYIEHTALNVLKDMKSRMKEGEGFNYGVGSIRAKFAKRFKSVDQIKSDRDQIIGSDDALKSEFTDRFTKLAEELRPFYRFDGSGFSYMNDAAAMFTEMADKGTRALDEGYKGIPDELMGEVRQFLSDLKDAPTRYFEAKIGRTVGLDEFRAAVVPKGTRKVVLDALKDHHVPVIEYDPKVKGSRVEAIHMAESQASRPLLFQSGPLAADEIAAENIVTEYARGNVSPAQARKQLKAMGWDVGPDGFRKRNDAVELIAPDGRSFRTYGQSGPLAPRGSFQPPHFVI